MKRRTTGAAKRAAAVLAGVLLCFSFPGGLAVGQTTPTFSDVPSGHFAEAAINWAASEGITTGVGNNRFGMGRTLTRYQMVTFLCRAFDPDACTQGSKGSDRFVDVPADHWGNYSVGWAVEQGITTGTSATEFSGESTLTREQMVTFLYRAKDSPGGGPNGSEVFNDAPAGTDHWANSPIGWAYQAGITGGISAGVFGFGTTLSRQEMVLFLCRAVAPDVCAPSHSPLASGVTTTTTVPTTTSTTAAPTNSASCEFPDHATRVSQAVFQVHTGGGLGTAFYIGNNEWLTAAHVVEGRQSVTLRRGNVSLTASVVGSNSTVDLTLLRAAAAGIPTLRFGALSNMGPGHPVYSVGYPVYVASQPSVTSGVFSRIETHAQLGSLLVTDAAVSPGNSGGPIVNKCGDVIGLVVSKIVEEGVEGISYAVVEQILQQHLPGLRGGGSGSSSSNDGTNPSAPERVGEWYRFSGEHIDGKYEGYGLGAVQHSGPSWESPPALFLRCGATSSFWDNIFVWTDWLIQSDVGDDGDVVVEYRFANMESLIGEWWWSNEDLDSAVFADDSTSEFYSRLREAGSGSLWMRIWNGFTEKSYSMEFKIDGVSTVLSHLECW